MPDLIGTLNRYSPTTGAVVGTLAIYTDGSARTFGDRVLLTHLVEKLRAVEVAPSETPPPRLTPHPELCGAASPSSRISRKIPSRVFSTALRSAPRRAVEPPL
jgi:hypothetical protein